MALISYIITIILSNYYILTLLTLFLVGFGCGMYYNVSFLFLLFLWCRCMAINVSVQYNGGLLPDIILLTQCYYHRGTNPFKCHEDVLSLQPLIPPNNKRFDVSPPVWEAQKV